MNTPASPDFDALPRLPGVSPLPGGGRIKAEPADFVVEEVPSYEPSGEGDHLYLWVEKEDVAARELIRQVARRLGIKRDEIGTAGMKDRRAVTRQWVSVPAGDVERAGTELEAITGPLGSTGHIRLLGVSRHTNKLRTGHLQGNRFTIRVRGRDPEGDEAVRALLEETARRGLPNVFGPQRFGRGESLEAGLALLRGERVRDRHLRRLGVSTVQAWIFNLWLSARIEAGLVEQALAGDVLKKRDSGGLFDCEDAAVDGARIAAGELVITGPLPGSRVRWAKDEALALELAALEQAGVAADGFDGLGRVARGTRRAALTWPEDVSVTRDDEGLVLAFTLDSGVYATVLLETLLGPLDVGPERGADRPTEPPADPNVE